MANEKVTQLPTVPTATLSDIIYAVQAGVSVQETLQQVADLISGASIISFPGNPNGNVAGALNDLVWDTSDLLLWICTVAGTIGTSVWIPIYGNMTNGQLLIGSTSNAPVRATLTAGTNISITNGAGSITIASTSSGSVTWNVVTTTSQSMVTNNGYIANNAGLVTLSLPSSASVGDQLKIIGFGAGGWTISQASGQQLIIGSSLSTVGAGGSVSSNNRYNSVNFICVVANTTWITTGAPQGNLTVV